MVASIEATHATWLINHKAFTVGYKGADFQRAKEANALMGYTLQATKAAVPHKNTLARTGAVTGVLFVATAGALSAGIVASRRKRA